MLRWFQACLLPPLAFQSVMIAGGYGTGQEFLVFFLNNGPRAGLLSMLGVTVPLLSICAVIAFEFARLRSAYDYRTFFRGLLGRGWFVWEAGFLLTLVLLFGVISSAAGEIVRTTFTLPYIVGSAGLVLAVALVVSQSNTFIERLLAGWAVLLYVAYTLFFVMGLSKFGAALREFDMWGPLDTPWLSSGARYAALQLSILPAIFFCLPHMRTRSDAVLAGLLTGPVAMIPGILFYLVMLTHFPAISSQVLPSAFLLDAIGSRALEVFFQLALLGTLVQTGVGVVHAFNQRLDAWWRARGTPLPGIARPAVALILMTAALLLTKIGLVGLLNLVYGTLAWFFMVIFIGPLFTVGVYRIVSWKPCSSPAAE
ncbi:MAG: hypothetical protein HYR49_11305 [Gammaproteobacteria bacterium]|nr:hypothetical protein [Gammaproteobacteria bacterium]